MPDCCGLALRGVLRCNLGLLQEQLDGGLTAEHGPGSVDLAGLFDVLWVLGLWWAAHVQRPDGHHPRARWGLSGCPNEAGGPSEALPLRQPATPEPIPAARVGVPPDVACQKVWTDLWLQLPQRFTGRGRAPGVVEEEIHAAHLVTGSLHQPLCVQ